MRSGVKPCMWCWLTVGLRAHSRQERAKPNGTISMIGSCQWSPLSSSARACILTLCRLHLWRQGLVRAWWGHLHCGHINVIQFRCSIQILCSKHGDSIAEIIIWVDVTFHAWGALENVLANNSLNNVILAAMPSTGTLSVVFPVFHSVCTGIGSNTPHDPEG